MLIMIAAISSLLYSIFVWVLIEKFEHSILSTLVGHEMDEIVRELAVNPETPMPQTASVQGYLKSRAEQAPIPGYLLELPPNVYSGVEVGDKTYHIAIHDVLNDRLYLSFDVTHLSKYGYLLRLLLIGGGIVAALFLLLIGIWISRKFLLPVSDLADEVANINPTQRDVRIEENYRDYEVGLIAKSIDHFMDRMDDFVEREQSFTAAVSHELRTPVTVISTATELLEMGDNIKGIQQGAVDRIKMSVKYMSEVIESMLFFARYSNETYDKTIPMIPVNSVFRDILQNYQARADDKGLVLRFNSKTNAMVRLPESHMAIILGNLVQNAIYNTEQGEVCVTVLDEGFTVEDTGKGIATDDIEHIFERRYHSSDSVGYGLGLHLVLNICNHYDFKLEIDSSIGKGSKFLVKYPATATV